MKSAGSARTTTTAAPALERGRGEPAPAARDATPDPQAFWMLVHQLPQEPPGLRMRIWRRLQEVGALQLKGSIYLLPATDAAREDLQWIVSEVRAAGAEASLWCASAIDGLDDDELLRRFRSAAAEQYRQIERDAHALREALHGSSEAARRSSLARLRARLADAVRRDHFGAGGRDRVEAALASVAAQLDPVRAKGIAPSAAGARTSYRGRTWVTRAGVGIDRMASAWLIRHMIDPQATFEFVPGERIAAAAGKLRFDTWGGEFTHEGDRCTFEVLIGRFALQAPGLGQLAEIVHDIDLKEARYAHPETAGIAASMAAITGAAMHDLQRIDLAATVFDGLLRQFAAAAAAASR
jgi:hypothetical protein